MPLPLTSSRWWREILMFSPIRATAATRSPSRSAFGSVASFRAVSSQKARKVSFLATKSVSQLISTSTPTREPARICWAMTPSFASRPAFLAAVATPFLRRMSTAAGKSPFASTSAFLQSIKPALVISRSLPTAAAVISAILGGRRDCGRRRGCGRSRDGRIPGGRAFGCNGRSSLRGGGFLSLFLSRVFGFVFGPRLGNGLRDDAQNQPDGTDRVVVARNRVIHQIRIAIGVHDGDDGNFQPAAFRHRVVLALDVHDEHHLRVTVHRADAIEILVQTRSLAAQHGLLLLDIVVDGTIRFHLFDMLEPADGTFDGLQVGECAAQPAFGHTKLAAGFRRL